MRFVRAEDANLSDVFVLAADEMSAARMMNEITFFDDEIGLAGDDAGRRAADDVEKIAKRAGIGLLQHTRVIEDVRIFVGVDVIRHRLVRIADVSVAIEIGFSREWNRSLLRGGRRDGGPA